MHQDEADLAAGGAAPLYPGFIPGGSAHAGEQLMRIAKRPNVIVTPHVAWASDEAQQALADQLIDNIENFVAGRPTNLVRGAF